MSRLGDLIREYCPNGAEYIQIKSVCSRNPKSRMGAKKAEDMEKGDTPFFTSGNKVLYVTEHLVDGENIFINDGGVAGFKYWNGKANYADHVISIHPEGILPKYMYYCLDSQREFINSTMFKGSGLKNIEKKKFFDFEIPLPPLPVQSEIVRILDAFQELTQELTQELMQELTDRRKQYEHYRDEMLNFDEIGVQTWTTIGEALGVNRGKRLTKSQLSDDFSFPVYHGSKDVPLGFYDKSNVEGNTVIVVNTGGIGGVKYCEEPFWCSDGSFWIGKNPEWDSRFVYYWLSRLEAWLLNQKRVGGVPTIDRETVESIKVPVLSKKIQTRIADFLDNFESVCGDLKIGLPAEIEARRKQYEFYRDAVLTYAGTGRTILDGRTDETRRSLIKVLQWIFGSIELNLKDVAVKIVDGMHNLPSELKTEGQYPVISAQNVSGGQISMTTSKYADEKTFERENRRTNAESGDVLLTIVGSIGRTAVVENQRMLFQRSICVIGPDREVILPKYLKFMLDSTGIQRQMESKSHGSAQSGLYLEQVGSLRVKLPPLPVQNRIVAKLDAFSSLSESISKGIPAEIELNEKRYEYWRDRLLSFRRKEA